MSIIDKGLIFLHRRRYNRLGILKQEYLNPPLPESINIGLTSHCNERCIMCPNSTLENKGEMSEALFQKIIDDMVRLQIPTFGPGLFGEPTIHPKFLQFLEYGRERGCKFKISSNGVKLTKEIADYFTHKGVGRLHISLYATDEESFKKIHGISSYNKTVQNIEYLLDQMAKNIRPEFQVFMNFIDMGLDNGGYEKWCQQWLPRLQKVNHLANYRKKFTNWSGQADKKISDAVLGVPQGNLSYTVPCVQILDSFAVEWDGRVTACCLSWNHESLHVGDMNREPLEQIWYGLPMSKLRQATFAGALTEYSPCQACSPYQRSFDPIQFMTELISPKQNYWMLAKMWKDRNKH